MSLVIFLIRLMKFLHFVVQLSHCRFVPGQGNLLCSLPFLPFSTVKGKAALFSTMDQHTGYRGVLTWKSISARDMEPPHHECHVTRLGVHLCFSICIHQSGKAFYSKVFFKYLHALWCWCTTEGCPHPKKCSLGMLWWNDHQLHFSLPFPSLFRYNPLFCLI